MRLNNQLKTIALLGGLSVFLIAIGSAIGPGATWIFLALALAMNLGAYFFSDRLVLRMHGAREIALAEAPALHELVAELAQRAGIPKPRVFLIDDPSPNAFATGRNPQNGVVAITRGLLDLLDRRELRGVVAHELAHVANRDVLVATIAAAVASAITSLAHALSFSALLGGGSDSDEDGPSAADALLLALVAPVAATLIQLGISRSREYLADESGARICGDPEALARALEKLSRGADAVPADAAPATASLYIVNPLAGGARVARWFSTHPPVEERVARLRGLALRKASLAA